MKKILVPEDEPEMCRNLNDHPQAGELSPVACPGFRDWQNDKELLPPVGHPG